MKVQFLCGECGGTDVSRDAWADWDVDMQQWTLRAAFDQAFCHDCDKEVGLEQRLL